MANIHKLELYIVDANGNYSNVDEIINMIENNTDCYCNLENLYTKEFDWDNDLDINKSDAKIESYEKYFKDGDK